MDITVVPKVAITTENRQKNLHSMYFFFELTETDFNLFIFMT